MAARAPTAQCGACAAGSVLGSSGSEGAICSSLAALHLTDSSAETLQQACDGEGG